MCELKFYYFLFPFVHESDEEQKEKKNYIKRVKFIENLLPFAVFHQVLSGYLSKIRSSDKPWMQYKEQVTLEYCFSE